MKGSSAEPKLEAVTPTVKGVEEMGENMFGRPTSCAPGWGAPSTSAATASSCWQMSGWEQALSLSASSSAS